MADRDRDFIINGITNGFEIIPSHSVLKTAETNNYKSATASDVQDKVENQIREEISKGNYVPLGLSQNQTLIKSGSNTIAADRSFPM